MTLREIFGANVRHYRLAKDLKQHQLAEAIDSDAVEGGEPTGDVAALQVGRLLGWDLAPP